MEIANKFFVKREDAAHIGPEPRISFATHVPKVISEEDALNLAAHLVKNSGGREAFEPFAAAIVDAPVEPAIPSQPIPEEPAPDAAKE
jgi:hypothetical protein